MRTERIATHLAPDAFRAGIERAVSAGAREIVLAGGEPRAELVALARARAERVVLETDARSLDDAGARALAAAGLDLARVTVRAWGDGLAGLESLGRAGVAIELQTPVARENLGRIAAIPGAAASSGFQVSALVLDVP